MRVLIAGRGGLSGGRPAKFPHAQIIQPYAMRTTGATVGPHHIAHLAAHRPAPPPRFPPTDTMPAAACCPPHGGDDA